MLNNLAKKFNDTETAATAELFVNQKFCMAVRRGSFRARP